MIYRQGRYVFKSTTEVNEMVGIVVNPDDGELWELVCEHLASRDTTGAWRVAGKENGEADDEQPTRRSRRTRKKDEPEADGDQAEADEKPARRRRSRTSGDDSAEKPATRRRRRSSAGEDASEGSEDKPARRRRRRSGDADTDDGGSEETTRKSRRRSRRSEPEEPEANDEGEDGDDEISDSDLTKAASEAAETIFPKGVSKILQEFEVDALQEIPQEERGDFLAALDDAVENAK